MRAWDSDALIELLDRQFEYLFRLHGTARLIRLRRLLAFLEADSRIAGLLQDAKMEADDALGAYEAADKSIRSELQKMWATHGAEITGHLRRMTPDTPTPYCEIDDYAARLHSTSPAALPTYDQPTALEKETAQLIDALEHWCKRVKDHAKGGVESRSEGLQAIGGLLARAQHIHEHASRRLSEAAKSLPWPAYKRLVEHARLTNPEPPATDDLTAWAQFASDWEFATNLLRGDEGDYLEIVEQHDLSTIYEFTETDAHLLHEELRFRIGLHRTRIALVHRYAALCEGFDAEQLRRLCARASWNAERHLTLHFARYMFDQGLLPLIDPTVGGLRPDVLHVGPSEPLYVEAKQYSARNPRSTLIKSYSQVWGTWSRVRKFHPAAEAFLVVFRRGGPLVELPPLIRYEGLKLHSILADISKEGGSREKSKIVRIGEADLLPMSRPRSP